MKHCGVTRNDMLMFPGLEVTDEQERAVRAGVSRRLSGEPLQYILGEWEFYGLPFYVGEGVLIPRQDTETIAEVALRFLKGRDCADILAADLCAGSGCIGITLAKLAGVRVKLLELSGQALEYLRRNIALNGAEALCEAVQADVLADGTAEALPKLDLIVTNPPYLTAQDMRELQREVTHEPETALFGGEDGLDFYRSITSKWKDALRPGGTMIFEVGYDQADAVEQMMALAGYHDIDTKLDTQQIWRAVEGRFD